MSEHGPVFLIGIGGSGMEPLAKFALLAGRAVSGSDSGIADEKFKKLTKLGAQIYRTHAAGNITQLLTEDAKGIGTVVYSTAIAPDHVERQAAEQLKTARKRLKKRYV